MKLREAAEYPGATPDQVFALIRDDDFRSHVCERIHAIAYEVTVTDEGGSVRIQIDRTLPAELPDFVRKLTGDTIAVRQIEVWGPAADDGSRTGTVDLTIKGQPASMAATGVLRPTADGAEVVVEGDLSVQVPFLGKKIEPMIAEAVSAALRTEAEEGRARLHD